MLKNTHQPNWGRDLFEDVFNRRVLLTPECCGPFDKLCIWCGARLMGDETTRTASLCCGTDGKLRGLVTSFDLPEAGSAAKKNIRLMVFGFAGGKDLLFASTSLGRLTRWARAMTFVRA